VLTGTLPTLTRDEAKDLIEAAGGKVSRLGVEEDRLRRRRRRGRQQAGQGAFDYVHVTRYGQQIAGGALSWRAEPSTPVSGRTLLLVDDILDEGLTLAAIRERLLQRGADACYTAVLADKLIGRKKPIAADFVALTVPDRFLFGYGMDVFGAWRNLPAIYAMRDD
jgi:hypoxanthine phosphoribosyltransferase